MSVHDREGGRERMILEPGEVGGGRRGRTKSLRGFMLLTAQGSGVFQRASGSATMPFSIM